MRSSSHHTAWLSNPENELLGTEKPVFQQTIRQNEQAGNKKIMAVNAEK
ncbi:hypothetical protein ACV980_010835 [Bacillus safensis]|nr:hypothetical protein R51_23360 [Bacillus safensis]